MYNELKILKSLKHENIVKYYGYHCSVQTRELNIFMEYMPQGSLQAMYQQFGPLNEVIIRKFTHQLLQALKYCHSHENKVIHGDIKAANILYDGKRVKLSDFGDSRFMDQFVPCLSDVSHSGVDFKDLHGSILFMAPEVI